jgi:hypothetical protein
LRTSERNLARPSAVVATAISARKIVRFSSLIIMNFEAQNALGYPQNEIDFCA